VWGSNAVRSASKSPTAGLNARRWAGSGTRRQVKKTCAPLPLPLSDVMTRVSAASDVDDWREVLKWEGRLVEVATESDTTVEKYLHMFERAHIVGKTATGSPHHALSLVRLLEQQIELLGKMERFRDQGESICIAANVLYEAGKNDEAMDLYERARNVGAAHGFFSVESRACQGLGQLARIEGRAGEGLDLMRNALAAVNPEPETLNARP